MAVEGSEFWIGAKRPSASCLADAAIWVENDWMSGIYKWE